VTTGRPSARQSSRRCDTKYYYANGKLVSLRRANYDEGSNGLRYVIQDHLGSTSITANEAGARMAELRYKPWGETRFSTGTTPTTWRFTGQREDATIGLYFYNAR